MAKVLFSLFLLLSTAPYCYCFMVSIYILTCLSNHPLILASILEVPKCVSLRDSGWYPTLQQWTSICTVERLSLLPPPCTLKIISGELGDLSEQILGTHGGGGKETSQIA